MRAPSANGEFYLGKLAELCTALTRTRPGSAPFFAEPLRVIRDAMGFSLSVLYRVENRVEDALLLEVVEVLDPDCRRPALTQGRRLEVDLARPAPAFRNEARAFLERGVAAGNVPGEGCDVVGYIPAGEGEAQAFLIGGDYVGADAGLQEADLRVFQIATGLLGALLLQALFQHRADYDYLTGLLSSARIRFELEHALQRWARRPTTALTVAIADIDRFKVINDRHGHLRGDAVLVKLGQIVSAPLRAGQDHAGRLGGEEFLLILEDTSAAAAWTLLERLRQAVEAGFAASEGDATPSGSADPIRVTISIGGCVMEKAEVVPPAAEVLALADRALYAAKDAGRNCVVLRKIAEEPEGRCDGCAK